jgi:syntaxin 7
LFRNPDEPEPTSQEQRQAQILQSQLSPHELAYQESLIQERENEIREIETGIHELAEIFHDLGTLVNQQGGMIGECVLYLHALHARRCRLSLFILFVHIL